MEQASSVADQPAPAAPAQESIMVVDDSPTVARVLEVGLRQAGYDVRVATSGEEALAMAQAHCPDLLLVDVMMPGMDGFELTRALREDARTAFASIIVITGRGLSADKLEGLSAGADDYIVKPFDEAELLARVRVALYRAKELRAQSPLTGLPGNIKIHDQIRERLRGEAEFAVLHIDLDNFKAYNDNYGFSAGDLAIKTTARLIQEVAAAMGGDDPFVGHVGGDDFTILASPTLAPQIATELIERFTRTAPDLYTAEDAGRGYIEGHDRQGQPQRLPLLSLSIGVASASGRWSSHPAEVVARATEMKEYVKRKGGAAWAQDRRAPIQDTPGQD